MARPETGFGTSDCERARPGFLSQPVNAVSSLAFVPAGAAIARAGSREIGVLCALIGAGSFAAHGPRWTGSAWLHDVTIAWTLAGIGLRRRRGGLRALAYAGLAAAFGLAPRWNNLVGGSLAAWVLAKEVGRRRTPASATAFALLALGAAFGNATRTGLPWCRPDSLLQGHAAWHVLAAASLAVWGRGDGAGSADRATFDHAR